MADNTITLQYDGSSVLLNGENLGIWAPYSQPITYGEVNVNYVEKTQVDEIESRVVGLISSNECQINNLKDEIKSLKKIISNLSTQLYIHLGQHQKQEAET